MSLTPIENRSRLPAKGLAACILGLVLSSFMWLALVIYFALYNTARFPKETFERPEFWLLILLQTICGSYLLYRFLWKPGEQPSSLVLLVCDLFSMLAVTVFIRMASQWLSISFIKTFWEVFFPLWLFLLAILISLPVVLIRETALQRRLMMRLPNGILMLLVALVLSSTVGTLFIVAMSPAEPTFIGNRYNTDE